MTHYNCKAISIPFEKLIEILENKSEIIVKICSKYNVVTDFGVVIYMNNGDNSEMVLSRKILSFATFINAEIGFCIYAC